MKEFILDLYITLNNNTELNLEMQVNNLLNWTDRSLSYLCRTFDNLCRGQDYRLTKPAIHIGILDYTLFPNAPEFYATYKLLNIKNHQVFNDKFTLNVLSLKEIEKATAEDKEWGLDIWARFFSAKTWRDIKMLAENNEILTSASKSLYEYNSDWLVRERCRAREDFENQQRSMLTQLAEQEKALAEKDNVLAEQSNTITEQAALIASLQAQIIELKNS